MPIPSATQTQPAYPDIKYDKVLVISEIAQGFIRPDGTVGGSLQLILARYRTLPDGTCEVDQNSAQTFTCSDIFAADLSKATVPPLPPAFQTIFEQGRDQHFGYIAQLNLALGLV